MNFLSPLHHHFHIVSLESLPPALLSLPYLLAAPVSCRHGILPSPPIGLLLMLMLLPLLLLIQIVLVLVHHLLLLLPLRFALQMAPILRKDF